MVSKASLIARSFGGGGAFSQIADKTIAAGNRKLGASALGDGVGGMQTFANMAALVAHTGMSAGDQALVNDLNKMFVYTGTGWFLIATLTNATPTITGANASYYLAADGTATTVTLTSTDPEGFPITFSHSVTTGSLGSTATVSQGTGANANVFTITPSTTVAGSFSLTFSASDGLSVSQAVSSFTLSFFPSSAHKITAPNPQNNSVRFGFSAFIGDTYYGASAPFMSATVGASTITGAGGVYAFNLSDNSALTGFNPLTLPGAATDDYGGYSVGYSAGKEIVVSAYNRGVGIAYLYTLPSTTATILSPQGWSGSGSTTFTVPYHYGSGSDTNTYRSFGRACAISPNGNYVAIMSHDAAQVQLFAGKAFGSYSKGDYIRTIQVTGNGLYGSYTPHAPYSNDLSKIDCNDTHVIVSQGSYHNNSNVGDVGRVTLYNMATGAEVTTGAFPYEGASADLHAGSSGVAITNNYAVISLTVNNGGPSYDGGYVLINLSDNSVVVRSVPGSNISQNQYVKLGIFKDEYVITGQYADGSPSGSMNGVMRVWKISDGTEKISSLFPLAGDAAGDLFMATPPGLNDTAIVAVGPYSQNGGSVATQGYIKLLT